MLSVTNVTGYCNSQSYFRDMTHSLKQHWEQIYNTKQPQEVSWTQEIPQTSLELLKTFDLSYSAEIIDIGGGDSKFVDHLIALGYTNVTVLDISKKAIERAKLRLGEKSRMVTWIVSDIVDFKPTKVYDLWHDRAAFHFLTEKEQVDKYLELTKNFAQNICIGTFSIDGPKKCSGLKIKQYDEQTLSELFEKNGFVTRICQREDHITPSNNLQNFIFCGFSKK